MVPNLAYLSGTRGYLLDETYPGTPWTPEKSDLAFSFGFSCFHPPFISFFQDAVPDSTIHTSVRPFTYHSLCVGRGGITESAPGDQGHGHQVG